MTAAYTLENILIAGGIGAALGLAWSAVAYAIGLLRKQK
jgi:hypothetical protein